MGDYFTTQLNHRKRALELLHDVQYWTQNAHYTHKKFLDSISEHLYQHNSYKRLTARDRSYVQGHLDAWMEMLYRSGELEWRVYYPPVGHLARDRYHLIEGKWSQVISGMGAHFWKGTDKVWDATDPAVFEMYEEA